MKSDFLGSRIHFWLGIWTRACEKNSRYYFDGVLVSSFGILGIIGNILTLCVLSRPKFRVCQGFMIKLNIIKIIEQTGLLSPATSCLGLFWYSFHLICRNKLLIQVKFISSRASSRYYQRYLGHLRLGVLSSQFSFHGLSTLWGFLDLQIGREHFIVS